MVIARAQGRLRPDSVEHRLVSGITSALAGEIEPQDPIADAAEDEAFRVAVARMEAAEAREDAAERKAVSK